jgi:signal peptidase I
LVQQELHPSDEGREGDGNPGEPLADQTSSGVFEAVTPDSAAPQATPLPIQFAHDPDAGFSADIGRGPAPPAEAFPSDVLPLPFGDSDAVVAGARPVADHAPLPQPHMSPVLAGGAALSVIGREVFAWLKTLVSAAVYATLIVTFGFQVARVEGQSMAPTLANQDRLIVNKFAYLIGSPRPGDIVMMYYPSDPDKSFVKRVIAEPGDVVKIQDGRVYVNDVRLADDFVAPEYRSHDDHPPKVVEDGYYYVLGDHRNNSSDSREWGEVPKKYIVGKVQLRWWPLPAAHLF